MMWFPVMEESTVPPSPTTRIDLEESVIDKRFVAFLALCGCVSIFGLILGFTSGRPILLAAGVLGIIVVSYLTYLVMRNRTGKRR